MVKTYKREYAVALTVVLMGFFIAGMWVPAALEAAKFLTIPILTLSGAAFGLDAMLKQR